MPAHNFDLNEPANVLRILLALVLERDGEIRIPAATYDSLDRGRLLTVDYDRKKAELVLRSTSDFGRAVVVQPEAVQWSMPPNLHPRERMRLQAEEESATRTMRSDEELADLEERLTRNAQVAADLAAGKSPTTIRVQR
jgi:hypothetical protein